MIKLWKLECTCRKLYDFQASSRQRPNTFTQINFRNEMDVKFVHDDHNNI
jgi:hypothetical protein